MCICTCSFEEPSYSGGGNITFKGTLGDNAQFTAKLFQGELLLGELPVLFTYSVKSEKNSLIGLVLELSSSMKEDKKSLLLASKGINQFSGKFSQVIVSRQVKKAETASGWIIQESSIEMNGYTITEISALCYWPEHERSSLKLDSGLDGQDNASTSAPAEYFAVLGDINIKTSGQNSDFPPSSSWPVKAQHIKWTSGSQGSKTLNVKLSWELKVGNDSLFHKYNMYIEKLGLPKETYEYLGSAHVKAFYVSDLVVPSGTDSLKFIIQVCSVDGTNQKLEDSPFFVLEVEKLEFL